MIAYEWKHSGWDGHFRCEDKWPTSCCSLWIDNIFKEAPFSFIFAPYPGLPYHILFFFILVYLALSYPILSCPILSYLSLSYSILSHHALSYSILSHHALSYSILSHRALSYYILSHLALPYPILLYLILFSYILSWLISICLYATCFVFVSHPANLYALMHCEAPCCLCHTVVCTTLLLCPLISFRSHTQPFSFFIKATSYSSISYLQNVIGGVFICAKLILSPS